MEIYELVPNADCVCENRVSSNRCKSLGKECLFHKHLATSYAKARSTFIQHAWKKVPKLEAARRILTGEHLWDKDFNP